MSVFEFLEMDGRDTRSKLPRDRSVVGGVCMGNEDSSPFSSQGEGPDDKQLEDALCELGAGAELNLELDLRVEPEDGMDLQGEELSSWEPEEQSNTSRSTATPEPTAASTGDWMITDDSLSSLLYIFVHFREVAFV